MVEVLRTLVVPPPDDPPLAGTVVSSVDVRLPVYVESAAHVDGVLSLRRGADGAYWIGVEVQHPVYFASPMRRHAFSLDEVLDAVWTPGVLGGRIRLRPMVSDGFSALPLSPSESVEFRVGVRDRDAAEAFVQAVALADLPDGRTPRGAE